MFTRSDRIAEALCDCITAAPKAEQDALFAALADYQETFGRTLQWVRQQPFADRMVSAIEDAREFVHDMEAE